MRTLHIFALALLVSTCGGESPGSHYAKAKTHFEQGEGQAAVIELKNALQKDPDFGEARLLLGRVYLEQNDGAAAEKELRRALARSVAPKEVLPLLARALLLQREYQKVLDEIPQDPALPASAGARIAAYRGEALAGLGRTEEARAAFLAALAMSPGLPKASRGLAALALAENKPEQAMKLAEEVLARYGDKAEPWVLKGDLLRARGQFTEALAAYAEALRREPKHLGAVLATLFIQLDRGDLAAAEKTLASARAVDARALPVRLASAQLAYQKKDYAGARDQLQDLLKVAPGNAMAVLLMGATQLALNAPAEAESYLSAFLARLPEHAHARRLLAAAQLAQGAADKTIDTLRPLLELGRDRVALTLAGEAAMKLADYDRATDYLERAASLEPADARIRTSLGVARLSAGDLERGIRELEAAATLPHSPASTDFALIVAELSQRRWDKALAAVAALEAKAPKNPVAPNLRGVAELGRGDRAAARRAFEAALALDAGYFPAAANLANLDLADNRPDAARARFQAVLAVKKDSVPAMVALADLETRAGRREAALAWLQKAAAADPKAIAPRARLVRHHLERGEPQRALAIAREAVAAQPDAPEALDLLGSAQLAAGQTQNAVATFGKLAQKLPHRPRAHLRLAGALVAAGNLEGARTALNRAAALAPDDLDAQLGLILLDSRKGRAQEAAARAQALQKHKDPRAAAAGHLVAGDLAAARGDHAAAAESYRRAFELLPQGLVVAKLYGALLFAGKPKEAEKALARWLDAHPEDLGTRLAAGELAMRAGQKEAALAHYRALLARQPRHLVALNNAAWLLAERRDPEALSLAEQAARLAPEDPNVLDTLGWILLGQGQTARAQGVLAKAVSLAPARADLRYHYARALLDAGDRARAREELERALAAGTRFSGEKEAQALLAQLKRTP